MHSSLLAVITLLTLCGSAVSQTAAGSTLDSTAPGVAIPLLKTGQALNRREGKNKIVDARALQAHVAHVDNKYRRTQINYAHNFDGKNLILGANIKAVDEDTYDDYYNEDDYPDEQQPPPSNQLKPAANKVNKTRTDAPIMMQRVHSRHFLTSRYHHRKRKASIKLKRQSQALTKELNGVLWAGLIQIGSNNQTFLMDFDTGSSDLWIISSTCNTTACTSHSRFNETGSSTAVLQANQHFSITYGDNTSSSGPIYTDNVSIGGLTSTNQYFSAVTQVSDSFENDVEDGLAGLAFQSVSRMNQPNFFQQLVSQNKTASPMFAFRLADTGSELYLGGVNPERFSGEIEWYPVVQQSYWVITGSAWVGDKKIILNRDMAIDSGTTVIIAKSADVKLFYSAIPGARKWNNNGYYSFPCSATPTVAFTFGADDGGKRWEISAENFNLGLDTTDRTRCLGAIIGQDIGMTSWILGDAFMKHTYSVFDMGSTPRVGFAIPV